MRQGVLALIALLVSAGGLLGWESYRIYRGVTSITGQTVTRATSEPVITVPALNSNQRLNFLILGSDNDKKKEEARPLTQSMIVVTVDPVHFRVTMLSIPRDFWVPIPGHGMGKIDLAHKYGGVQLARSEVERLFHIPIDYYAWVGLNGFIKVIDTFNGITINVNHPILDDNYPNDLSTTDPYGYMRVFLPAGWQHLDGSQALQYVRSRHGDLIGDFGRSQRQQQVLLALDQKITALNVLKSLPQLMDDLAGNVQTDLTTPQLIELDQMSHHITPTDVKQVVLAAPTYCTYSSSSDGQSILIPNWKAIRPLVRSMFGPIFPPSFKKRESVAPTAALPTPTLTTRAGPTATPTPTASPTPTVSPTPTTPSVTHLPGNVFFVRGGNLFELTRTGSTRQLTYTGDVAMPALSPNGRMVALVRFHARSFASDVWVLDLHTRRMRQLTHDVNPLGVAQPDVRNNRWAAWPTWSSDGRSIIFSWDRQNLADGPPQDSRPVDLALWTIGLAPGSAPVGLTVPFRGSGGDTQPATRPRSSQVALVRWNYVANANVPYSQLAIYSPTLGSPETLTPVGGRVLDPEWNKSGNRIVYVRRNPAGVDEVTVGQIVSSARGPRLGSRTVLASGEVAGPGFTPDGKWVSYLKADGDGFALYLVPTGGGAPRIVEQAGTAIDARWQPIWAP